MIGFLLEISPDHIVCREAMIRQNNLFHAVIEMGYESKKICKYWNRLLTFRWNDKNKILILVYKSLNT